MQVNFEPHFRQLSNLGFIKTGYLKSLLLPGRRKGEKKARRTPQHAAALLAVVVNVRSSERAERKQSGDEKDRTNAVGRGPVQGGKGAREKRNPAETNKI